MKVCSNGPGHMTKVAATPIYGNTPIPLDGTSATIRNFDKNDANRSRNGKSVVEAQ